MKQGVLGRVHRRLGKEKGLTPDFIFGFSSVAALKCYNCWGRDENHPKNKLEANKDYYEMTCHPGRDMCISVC